MYGEAGSEKGCGRHEWQPEAKQDFVFDAIIVVYRRVNPSLRCFVSTVNLGK